MESRVHKDFPYEIQDLEGDRKLELQKSFYSLREYIQVGPKGYLVYKEYEKEAANIYNMKVRPSDVFVATYQRSGTTWMQELVWMVLNNVDFETSNTRSLASRYAFLDGFMYTAPAFREEIIQTHGNNPEIQTFLKYYCTPAHVMIENAPDPRFVKTHLPMSLMPRQALDVAKVVYVARDPRDVTVSSYYHAKLLHIFRNFKVDLKEYWNNFYKDKGILTPYFEHIKEAWDLRNHPNMLFMFYEEMSKDLPGAIKKVASFFDKTLTEKQTSDLWEHLKIENFKNNTSVNFEEMRQFNLLSPKETFIRKGKAGGWREHFDKEMTEQAEQWITDNLKDTDLRFPS